MTSSSTPDGNAGGEVAETTYGYDGDGELTSVVAPGREPERRHRSELHDDEHLHKRRPAQTSTVSHTGGSITARETQYGYDGDGNRTSVEDARGKTTDYAYNADDELTLVTDPDSQQTLTCYDGDGNVTETVPPVGVAANSLTAASCPTLYPAGYGSRLASDATTYTYDALGDKTTITTPPPAGLTGYETTTNAYDPAGRLTSVNRAASEQRAVARPTKSPSTPTTTPASYSPRRRIRDRRSAARRRATATTPTATRPPPSPRRQHQLGRELLQHRRPIRRARATRPATSTTRLGELVSKTTPTTSFVTSPTWTYGYDPAGNLLTSEDPNGVTTTNTYTPLNQLATVSYSGSSAPSVSYSYDANGNRVSMSDGTGTSSYGYDVFNELTSYENGAGNTVSYSYDADGNTTGITYPLGAGATWATQRHRRLRLRQRRRAQLRQRLQRQHDHDREHRRRAPQLARARLDRRHDQHHLRPNRHPLRDQTHQRLDAAGLLLQRRPLRRDQRPKPTPPPRRSRPPTTPTTPKTGSPR